jgi:hypothetical protein
MRMEEIGFIHICLGTLGGVLLLWGAAWAVGKFFLPDFPRQWAQVAEELGLDNRSPEGIYPDWRGRIDRVNVAVDVIFQAYASAGANTARPWLRARAMLDAEPAFQLHARKLKVDEKPPWGERPSGDPAFDARYRLFAAEGTPLDQLLPPAARTALLEAPLPIQIIGRVVLWTEKGFNIKPERVKTGVHTCVAVAAAINGLAA